jgi:hypothetical protein
VHESWIDVLVESREADRREIAPDARTRRRHLVAFACTALVVALVVVLLPIATYSMVDSLWGQESEEIFDMFTGQPIDGDDPLPSTAAFINVVATGIDETAGIATLTVSGHRLCPALCPALTGTFYSLGSDAARRHGLPPSAKVTVPGEPGAYTFSIQLPIHGTAQRYPFDTYTLVLGMIASATLPNGEVEVIDAGVLARHAATLTVESDVVRLEMSPPLLVAPASVRSPSDPVAFAVVNKLEWQRPLYLRILTVLLVVLITVSSFFALGMRSLSELVLGVGGIILGIWGVRSVVVQTPLPDVTLVDLLLAFVMLLMLLALTVRAARHFFHVSGVANAARQRLRMRQVPGRDDSPPLPSPTAEGEVS